MVVHIVSSYREHNETDLRFLRCIKAAISSNESTLSRDWIDLVTNKVKNDTLFDEDWSSVIADNAESLRRSDVCIIEATNYGFYDGYQFSQALDLGLPVLIVGRINLKKWAVSGISSPQITLETYETEEQLSSIIGDFLKQQQNNRMEVSVAADSIVYSYIKDLGERSHKTDGELLADLAKDGIKYRRLLERDA